MGSPTPAGPFIQPLTDLRTLLAGITALQSWLGVATATEAAKHLHLFECDFQDMVETRWAIIGPRSAPIEFERDQTGHGLAAFHWTTGAAFGLLEEVETYTDDSVTDFLNNVYLAISGILDMQGTAAYKRVDYVHQLDYKQYPLRWRHGEHRGYQAFFEEGMSSR